MPKLRIRNKIPISKLAVPSPVITRDGDNRITQKDWQYGSFYVRYDATWEVNNNVLISYTQTIGDGVAP